jgi:pimeloyl-ACP methyl ester carboxylesterase
MKEHIPPPLPMSNRETFSIPAPNPEREAQISDALREREVYEFGEEQEEVEQVEIIDISADEHEPKSTVLIAPGFGEIADVLEPSLQYFAREGRRAITYNSLVGVSLDHVEDSGGEQIPTSTKRKLAIIERIIDEKKLEGVTGVGHSEGAVNLVFSALRNPTAFKNLILIDPAGLIGDDSMASLFKRFVYHQRESGRAVHADPNRQAMNEETRVERGKVVTQHAVRTLETLSTMASVHIEDLLQVLKERGAHISIIHGADDVLFPMERMQRLVDGNMIDGFYSIRGGHNDYFLEPEKYSFTVSQAIEALEAKDNAPEE